MKTQQLTTIEANKFIASEIGITYGWRLVEIDDVNMGGVNEDTVWVGIVHPHSKTYGLKHHVKIIHSAEVEE